MSLTDNCEEQAATRGQCHRETFMVEIEYIDGRVTLHIASRTYRQAMAPAAKALGVSLKEFVDKLKELTCSATVR